MRRPKRVLGQSTALILRGIDVQSIFQYALTAFAVRRLAFASAGLLLAGCAGGSTQTASQTPIVTKGVLTVAVVPPAVSRLFHVGVQSRARMGSVEPQGNGKFVTTLQAYGSDANVYQVTTTPPARPRKRAPGPYLMFLSSFTTGLNTPYGATITPSGTWYIANSADFNVLVFTLSSSGVVTGPTETLSDPNGEPIGVDSNTTGSLVAVADGTPSGQGALELYAGGSTTPTKTLGVAGAEIGIGVALDKANNCYWSYNSVSGTAAIVEFPKCRGSEKPIATVAFAGGLAFNEANDLFYTDQMAGTVNRCNGHASCHVLASGFSDPWGINFDSGWKHLWLTDVATGSIYALNPKTGAILSTTPGGTASDPPFGIAAAPGPKY
jgi:DNA-binding beta-propeller fold protein YncE